MRVTLNEFYGWTFYPSHFLGTELYLYPYTAGIGSSYFGAFVQEEQLFSGISRGVLHFHRGGKDHGSAMVAQVAVTASWYEEGKERECNEQDAEPEAKLFGEYFIGSDEHPKEKEEQQESHHAA